MRSCSAFWAFEKYENDLKEELKYRGLAYEQRGLLFLTEPTKVDCMWAQMNLHDCMIVNFSSITEASDILKTHAKRWCSNHVKNFRRAQLIQEKTFRYNAVTINFLEKIKDQDWSFWSLLDERQMLICPTSHLRLPNNEFSFYENKTVAPSRAYLKLWEAFTLHNIRPDKDQKVIDLGSCPGGWTWVLQQMGCKVISVDKAPLAPQIAKLPHIKYIKQDAFKIRPQEIGPVDWLFSDIICYPEKLLELVQQWQKEGLVKNFFCSIKFKGSTNFNVLEEFLKFPNSKIRHLLHNKHEVSWSSLDCQESKFASK